MNISNFLKIIEPIQDQLTGFYAAATLIISIFIILWFLNFLASIISTTFTIGKSFGSFYRNYILKYIRPFFYGINYLISSKDHSKG